MEYFVNLLLHNYKNLLNFERQVNFHYNIIMIFSIFNLKSEKKILNKINGIFCQIFIPKFQIFV